MTLSEAWSQLQLKGPTHVLLNREGQVMMSAAARKQELAWDIVYLRDDGYSLACDFYLAQYAENMHREKWIGFIQRGQKNPRPLTPISLDTEKSL